MSADRPVSAPDTVTDDMVRVAAEAAHKALDEVDDGWHYGCIGSGECFKGEPARQMLAEDVMPAVLEAVVPLIRAQIAADLIAEAVRAAHDHPAEFTSAYLGEWLARQREGR